MFFKELSEIAPGMALTIRIQEKNGTMAVSVVPDGVDKIQPLVCNGTPEQLDTSFFDAIRKPVALVKEVIVNAAAFDAAEVETKTPVSKSQPDGKKVKVAAGKPTPKKPEKAGKKKPTPKQMPAEDKITDAEVDEMLSKEASAEKPQASKHEKPEPELTPLERMMLEQ